MKVSDRMQVFMYVDPAVNAWGRPLVVGTAAAAEIAVCLGDALHGTPPSQFGRCYDVTHGGLIAAGPYGFKSIAEKLRDLKVAAELAVVAVDAVLELQSKHPKAEPIWPRVLNIR